MKPTKTLMLGPKDLELERLVVDRQRVTLFVSTTGSGAKCPVCAVATLVGCTAVTPAP